MGRIYMRVLVHNETQRTLVLRASGLAHGDWTPGGWLPPDKILAGQTGHFQSEGGLAGVATTGTEGTVEYTIADGDEDHVLHIHFNSSLIESQYGNTFHVFAPPGYEVSDRGGQGERGELHVRLRTTQRRQVARFNVRERSLDFANRRWPPLPVVTVGRLYNRLWDSLPGPMSALDIAKLPDDWLPLTDAETGLCGGMVFTVMDYFHAGELPTKAAQPTTADDPLFEHIRERLLASFDLLGGGWRYLAYSSPLYPNGDEGAGQAVGLFMGRSWITYREQWPLIQDDIDEGRLSPLGLIQTDRMDVGKNHQVLCYGYERNGQQVTLYVYDPNLPRQEVTLVFDVTSTSGPVRVTRTPDTTDNIWAIFRTNGYQPRHAPGGRPFDSVRSAILSTTDQRGTLSVRTALAGTGHASVRPWLADL